MLESVHVNWGKKEWGNQRRHSIRQKKVKEHVCMCVAETINTLYLPIACMIIMATQEVCLVSPSFLRAIGGDHKFVVSLNLALANTILLQSIKRDALSFVVVFDFLTLLV